MHATRLHILEHLHDHGRGTVESLAEEVKLAPVTVRHHLNVLRDRGMVLVETESVGRGRPRHVYLLSSAGGEALLGGQQYADLLADLLGALSRQDGEAGEQFFRDMANDAAEQNRALYEGAPVERRLDVAAKMLTDAGYSVRWERDGDEFVMHQLGCPFKALSETREEVCCLDSQILKTVVGGEVAREEWRREGSATCSYRIALNGHSHD